MDTDTNFQRSQAALGTITLELSKQHFFGLRHGFTGQGVFNPGIQLLNARQHMQQLFSEVPIILPEQSHSAIVIQVNNSEDDFECAGDALFISRALKTPLVLGICTADCVPLLIASQSAVALVHAGWRGLANCIISKTLTLFKPHEPLSVLIGPCGGKEVYQVEQEVLLAIGSSAVSTVQSTAKYLLDLPATAQNQILACHPQAQIFNSAVCTITDRRFNSYRRDHENSGRNLSFIELNRKGVSDE